jgi:hypothetical protein
MIDNVVIYPKENGFALIGVDEQPEAADKEMVVEGKDPKKIGAAVLALFQKPRQYKPREKKAEVTA